MRKQQKSLIWGAEVEERAWRELSRRSSSLQISLELIRRNFRCREGEIDLVLDERCLKSGRQTLVFVEVRGRHRDQWVSAVDTVTFPKRRKLERAARRFLARNVSTAQSPWESLRFDVVGFDGQSWQWVRDAWREGE